MLLTISQVIKHIWHDHAVSWFSLLKFQSILRLLWFFSMSNGVWVKVIVILGVILKLVSLYFLKGGFYLYSTCCPPQTILDVFKTFPPQCGDCRSRLVLSRLLEGMGFDWRSLLKTIFTHFSLNTEIRGAAPKNVTASGESPKGGEGEIQRWKKW